MPATMIGHVTGTDISSGITIPITTATPANGIIVVGWGAGNGPTGGFADQFHISAATDTSAVTYSINHTGANVGAVGDQTSGFNACYGGSVTRTCTASDLSPGDSVHLTENFSSFPTTATFAAVVICIPGASNTAVAWEDPLGSGASVDYSNNDLISSGSLDGHTLNEATDRSTHPYPASDSVMIAVSASYVGYAWTPAALTKAGEAVGTTQVAVCVGNVTAHTTKEAGGSFSGNPTVGILGFQFALGTIPASGAHAHHRRHRR